MGKRERIWIAIIGALLAGALIMFVMEGIWVGQLISVFITDAEAEELEGRQCWVLCMPDGLVNVRSTPKKNGRVFGWAQCGVDMLTDEKTRNGFLHVYDVAAEESEGWISAKYIVFDEPEEIMAERVVRAEGRVACRKAMGGKVTRWAHDGDRVTVYWMSEEWATTNMGYIMSEFLTEEGE